MIQPLVPGENYIFPDWLAVVPGGCKVKFKVNVIIPKRQFVVQPAANMHTLPKVKQTQTCKSNNTAFSFKTPIAAVTKE